MAVINKVNSIEQLDALFERSKTEPVVLFKHSNSCGISSHVLEMASEIECELNVIVIQENRSLSNEVAIRTGYTHQSPQAFILISGKPVYHATHYGIDPNAIAATISASSVDQ
ncbi:MAG: bacillithiol system redox-active protein YtxJ [Pyrinomonadaceae bacterium]